MTKILASFLDLLNPSKWPAYRKSLVALAGLVLQAAPLLALTGPAQHWVQLALAGATWVVVHLTPNTAAKVLAPVDKQAGAVDLVTLGVFLLLLAIAAVVLAHYHLI